ncbi:MAG: ADP-ribose pyrophosphatase [Coxiella sp. DG_40]|nr:MAG: ADP-ribose pyrophosphatase [Coxiella sp. DG_40]
MTHDDVKILEEKSIYEGFSKIIHYKLRHRLFKGGWSKSFERELSVRYNAVAVLPYDPKLDKVVLIEQFRIGALKDKTSPWLLELVAGVIDKQQPVEKIAYLETKEEAGLDIIDLIPIYSYWSSPGGSSEFVSLYCAIVDASKANGIHGMDDEHEDILVHVMNSEEAFAAVKSGRINNASTIIALQWLQLNYASLRSQNY